HVIRPVRIDNDVYRTAGLDFVLFDDPAADGGGFFPMDPPERVAADVVAEGVDLRAAADPARGVPVPFDKTKAIADHIFVEETRKDDHVAGQPDPSLLQKKAEGVTRVELDAAELHEAPPAKAEHHVCHDLPSALNDRDAERRGQLVGRYDHIANVPDVGAVEDAQAPVRRPHGPRFIDAVQF